jgi:hypothetical protein
LSACQKADGSCFLGQERGADGGIHATRDHNKVTNVLQNTKKNVHSNENADIQCSALHDNACLHTAARTRALLEHFNWELFDHPPYSPDLAPSSYHLFIYLTNWLRSQCFNNNEELKKRVIMWLSSQVANFSDTGLQKHSLLRKVLQFWW